MRAQIACVPRRSGARGHADGREDERRDRASPALNHGRDREEHREDRKDEGDDLQRADEVEALLRGLADVIL